MASHPASTVTVKVAVVKEAAITAPSVATVQFAMPAFTAVPKPPEPKLVVKRVVVVHHADVSVQHATYKRHHRASTVHRKAARKAVKHAARKHATKHTKHTRHVAKRTKAKKAHHHAKKATRAGRSIISIARSKVGSPYRYGAAGPNAFDCSGFVGYVYHRAGRSLPRTARAMYSGVRHVSNPRPGDIIFFINGGHATHAGIYAGHGKMYDAPHSGTTVGLHAYRYYNGTVRFGRA